MSDGNGDRPTVVSSTPLRELEAVILAREADRKPLGTLIQLLDEGRCVVELEEGALDLIVGMFGTSAILVGEQLAANERERSAADREQPHRATGFPV